MLYPQEKLSRQLDDASLSHQSRLLIGQKLAEFGDPRPGVGVKDGLPDIAWIEIPGGHVHALTVKPFRMAKYPVTNVQFDSFINAEDGYQNKEWWKDIQKSDHAGQPRWLEVNVPRETVSWYEAVAFCRWLSAKTKTSVRLPSEWEWQKAATGGDPQHEYPWKDKWGEPLCNSVENRSRVRVIRGGSWNYPMEFQRCLYRSWGNAGEGHSFIGFRLAQDIEP